MALRSVRPAAAWYSGAIAGHAPERNGAAPSLSADATPAPVPAPTLLMAGSSTPNPTGISGCTLQFLAELLSIGRSTGTAPVPSVSITVFLTIMDFIPWLFTQPDVTPSSLWSSASASTLTPDTNRSIPALKDHKQ